MTLTRDTILAWPKADLHCHLDGSLRLSTLLDLARKQGKLGELPSEDPAALQGLLEAIDASSSLADFLIWFKYTIMVMQDAESLHRIAYELVEDAARENVTYLEVRYSPIEHRRGGLSLTEVNDAVLAGLRDAERDTGTKARVIICGLRDRFESESFRLAELAVAYKNRGVVAFDLAGGEAGNPAKLHVHAFAHARDKNLNITVHAGEAWGPASIHQAIHDCGAHRIGHGVTLREDEDLLQYVIDHRIPLEICPTSNVQTRVVQSLAQHPIRNYIDNQVRVTVNTDNRLFSRTTSTDELWRCHTALGLDERTLKWIVLNGFKSAFLPYGERQALLQQVLPVLDVSRSTLEPPASR
ncbi:MAG: adenosine deaminase [Candidatus Sericytochromatia bacterium]|nr:adenosine deaminase [Candidatus Sericytochromatia bacterium]